VIRYTGDRVVPGVKIAIVGAGVSGLVAARLLQERHEITVFEAGAYAGGHTNTIRVDTAAQTHWVDTGFIVFNDRNYPSFTRLLGELGVDHQPSRMSFAVADEGGDFEYSSGSVGGLYAKTRHAISPTFQRMVVDYMRFNRKSRELLAGSGDPPLREWLDECGFSPAFVERLIVPQASAVWSADPDQLWSFPARFLVEFFDNHGMLELTGRPKWMTVKGGSKNYVEQLIAPFQDRLRLSCPIAAVRRFEDRVEVVPTDGEAIVFDEVVLAVHSDQALKMLGADATATEHAILGAIPYQANEAVLHTDERLLPRRRRAWSSWNYHLMAEPPDRTTVTYHMNQLQALEADREFCVTLNRSEAIAPERVIRIIAYEHPVFTAAGVAAQQRHHEISGVNRTHYCGAYWGWGFHEDGVVSALRACAAVNA
jgi:predicted NAD/FAD-binding protein